MERHSLIVILGPTASGKSSLGIDLARRFGGIVISADSRQVYRGLDLGSGKVTKREMHGVHHELLDVASPRRQYSVARYVRDVDRVLRHLPTSVPVFLVGGSPFYIKAVTEPGSFSPVPPDAKLRRRLAGKTTTQLVAILRRRDPGRLDAIDTANRRRLIRAIEIASDRTSRTAPVLPPLRILKIGVKIPAATLRRNITRRVDARMERGMLSEVHRLHRQGVSWQRLDDFGLEYRYLSRRLRGLLTPQAADEQLKSAIRDFAKRQMTWWKRETDIRWTTPKQASRLVAGFLS